MAQTDFHTALHNTKEISLTVTGRKSSRSISFPVWFVQEGDTLLLLPARGLKTEWYKNLSKTPTTS